MDSQFDTTYEPFLASNDQNGTAAPRSISVPSNITPMQGVVTAGRQHQTDDYPGSYGYWSYSFKTACRKLFRSPRCGARFLLASFIIFICLTAVTMLYFWKDEGADTLFDRHPDHFRRKHDTSRAVVDHEVDVEDLHEASAEYFESYLDAYKKRYSPSEKQLRFQIYKQNLAYIYQHNSTPGVSYKLALNQFADMTNDEYKRQLGLKIPEGHERQRAEANLQSGAHNLPDHIDWRRKGCVTPVKNQGACGSCWAFAAIGSMEGAYCLAKDVLLSLSEQQIVDCDMTPFSQGCEGGFPTQAFKWVEKHNGICSEDDYPYLGIDHKCRENSCKNVANINSFVNVQSCNAEALKEGVAIHGPTTVAIDAGDASFQFYESGVYSPELKEINLNHAVLVVGYGFDKVSNKPYWTVKNSWDTSWGLNGYILIDAGEVKGRKDGYCGILSDPSYAVVN